MDLFKQLTQKGQIFLGVHTPIISSGMTWIGNYELVKAVSKHGAFPVLAGGHIGHVSLTILLQQVLFNFRDFPIFVAGGIATGKMIAHLLLMGAYGCQLGTRFVMTEEYTAHAKFKDAFIKARARETIATPQCDSRLPVVAVRAVNNCGMRNFGQLRLNLLKKMETGSLSREEAQFEVENYWMGALRRAVVDGDVDSGSLMAGQSVGLMHDVKPMCAMLDELVDDARDELERVCGTLGGK
ncbi:nitronate monooxygenase [bacterium]|nr:nitronate monooxygenase [bacterium]